MKKFSALTLSTVLVFSGIAPTINAEESVTEEQTQQKTAKVDESSVSVEELIKKVRELFPERLKSAKDEYFNLDIMPRHPEEEEDVKRYSLSYFDRSQSNPEHLHFEFIGEDLELSSFHYHSENNSDALFPPKVSKEEAEKLAKAFMDKLDLEGNYELNTDDNGYYYSINRPLTEPIEYRFTFDKLKDGIPIQHQSVSVTILGNGEITQFNKHYPTRDADFESATGLKSKEELLKQLKDNLKVDLQYMIREDYETREVKAYLTYRETPMIRGISAKNGKYYINGEYVDELPEQEEVKMLAENSKAPEPVSKEEAKAIAKKLLATDDEDTTLQIEQAIEREMPDGTVIYDIRYMYYTGSSGHGSSIQINKNTGELVRFSESMYNPRQEVEENVSYDEALDLAVDYINEYAYTKADEYAYPVNAIPEYGYEGNQWYFTFPRVKNGLIVSGDNIHVGVSKEDGRLLRLYVRSSQVDQWPSVDDAVSKEQALEDIKANLDLKLYYVDERNQGESENKTLQYKLSYLRNDSNGPTFYNAVTGEWESISPYGQKDEEKSVSHPWAEEELNYLISNNILEVKDPKTFDGDKALTKGEALEILIKSVDRVYRGPSPEEVESSPFENINSDHDLYNVVMTAVRMGILDTEQKTFNVEEKITREQLAYWYVRALGLDSVAKRHDIFNYTFNDTAKISDKYRGYVVLADSLGLLTKNYADNFLSKEEVTYAQIAVSSIRLAKLIISEDFDRY